MLTASEYVRCALKSESGFLDFLRSGKSLVRVGAVLAFGVLLILLGSVSFGSKDAEATPEEELAEMCSATDGVGESRVMITYGDGGEVYGVAVLCEGAESPEVRARIVRLIGSLYGIGANRISVLKISK